MSNLLTKKKEQGFTLIEIVLVLAIAALIIVMVFLALSGANKSRRDTQRKTDVSRIAASLETYAANNSGDYPSSGATWTTFWTNYVANGNYKDPSTGAVYTQGTNTYSSSTASVPSAVGQVTFGLNGRTYQLCMGTEQGTDTCTTNQ